MLIVFDLDGTLVDSRQDLADSANAMLARYGAAQLPDDLIVTMVGDGAPTLVRRVCAAAGLPSVPNDALESFLAHYDARLLGVWCIEGPPVQLVFPRAGLQVAVAPGCVAVFDPFEVHGVLAPGRRTYAASDYQSAEVSAFVGFELDIGPTVADVFEIQDEVGGHLISSRTRINASSGGIESFS